MRKRYWLSSMMASALLDYLKVKKIEALLDKSSLLACILETFNGNDLIVSATIQDNSGITTCVIVKRGLLIALDKVGIIDSLRNESTTRRY